MDVTVSVTAGIVGYSLFEPKRGSDPHPLSFCYNSKKGWGCPTSIDITSDNLPTLVRVFCPAEVYKRLRG
jgi:hypothetical protein